MTLRDDRDEEAFSGEDPLRQHWALNTNKADNLTLEGYP